MVDRLGSCRLQSENWGLGVPNISVTAGTDFETFSRPKTPNTMQLLISKDHQGTSHYHNHIRNHAAEI